MKILILIILILLLRWLIKTVNGFQKKEIRVQESLSGIEVALTKRYDLANYSGYSNTKVDELLQKARETDDNTERLSLYREFQDELAKDLPYTFIAYVDAIYVGRSNVHGITADTVLGHHGVGIFWNIADWTIS